MPRMVKPVLEGDDDWQAHADADTLVRAAEIKADKPRRMKAHKKLKGRFHHTAHAMNEANPNPKPTRFTARAKLGADE